MGSSLHLALRHQARSAAQPALTRHSWPSAGSRNGADISKRTTRPGIAAMRASVATITRGPNTNALRLVSYESKVLHRAMGLSPRRRYAAYRRRTELPGKMNLVTHCARRYPQ